MLDEALGTFAQISADIALGAEPEPLPEWTERQKKVWLDSQKPAREVPFYLSTAADISKSVAKAEAESGRPATPVSVGVIIMQGETSRADWQQRAAESKKADEEKARKFIDAREDDPAGH